MTKYWFFNHIWTGPYLVSLWPHYRVAKNHNSFTENLKCSLAASKKNKFSIEVEKTTQTYALFKKKLTTLPKIHMGSPFDVWVHEISPFLSAIRCAKFSSFVSDRIWNPTPPTLRLLASKLIPHTVLVTCCFCWRMGYKSQLAAITLAADNNTLMMVLDGIPGQALCVVAGVMSLIDSSVDLRLEID